MNIILASGSPRRRELLKMIVDEFEVMVSECEERITKSSPSEVTKELSTQKAEAVVCEIQAGSPAFLVMIFWLSVPILLSLWTVKYLVNLQIKKMQER